jgi:hypothetical protein
MKSIEENNRKQVLEMLETLSETPQRDPGDAARGKSRFLAEARSIELAVSPSPIQRLSKWMGQNHLATKPFIELRKERSRMFTAISSIILALAVVIGGGGITAYAAQESLPNDALYPVKLFLEDTTYSLASDLETQVSLLTTFANNRIDEIVTLSLAGEPVPEDVVADLQSDLDTMLSLAADAADDETEDLLKYIRQNLRDRDQLMTMSGAPDGVESGIGHMLQAQHQRAQVGIEDPLQFKLMYRNNWEETAEETEDATGPKGNQTGDCTEEDCEPQGPKGPNAEAGGGNEAAPGPKGPKYEWDDTGNENGNADPGNADPGNAAPGNADPGTGDGNADPGNAAPGNPDPGNGEAGDPDPGDPDPGDPDPGNPNPGEGDPGNPDPGNPDPGNPDPGKGGGGDDETP